MTKNETLVLNYVTDFKEKHDYSPSFAEIQEHFGWSSKASVQNYIKQLSKKGFIEQPPHQKRALKILQPSPLKARSPLGESVRVPLLGSVAAGLPLEKKSFDEYIDVPLHLAPHPEESFVVRVSGDSMIECGIFDKDLLLIEACSYAENGNIVIAATEDDAATVKRFYKRENTIELKPENSSLNSQFYQPHEITIKGKVVGLIRRY